MKNKNKNNSENNSEHSSENNSENNKTKASKIIKSLTISSIILAISATAGCGITHKNELLQKQNNPKQIAHLIYNAEYYARTKNSFIGTYEYMHCIQDPETNGKSICNKLFNLMKAYINKQKGYSSVSIADIKDAKVWDKVSKDIDFLYANG